MEVMLRIPTPMPTNNQNASRDERQALLMRNSSVCNECRKILFSARFQWQSRIHPMNWVKALRFQLAEVWSCARRLRWSSTRPEPLDPWILLGNPAISSFPLQRVYQCLHKYQNLFQYRICQTDVDVINCFSKLQFQKSRWNPRWHTLNHHPIN